MTQQERNDYIQSEEWKEKSRTFIKEVGCCEWCGSVNKLESHHITYKNLGKETRQDIQVLCRDCHEKIPSYKKPLEKTFKEQLETANKDAIFRKIQPTLTTSLQEKIGGKVLEVEVKERRKTRLKDWRKQVYYKDGKFRKYALGGWLKFIEENMNDSLRFLKKTLKRLKKINKSN